MSPPKETVLFPLEAQSPKEPLTPPLPPLPGRAPWRAGATRSRCWAGTPLRSTWTTLTLTGRRSRRPTPSCTTCSASSTLSSCSLRSVAMASCCGSSRRESLFIFIVFYSLCLSSVFRFFSLPLFAVFFSLSLFFVFVSSSFFRFSLSLYLTAFHLSLTSVFALLTSLFSPLFLSPPTLFSLSHSRYLSLSPTLLSLSYSFLFSFR